MMRFNEKNVSNVERLNILKVIILMIITNNNCGKKNLKIPFPIANSKQVLVKKKKDLDHVYIRIGL